MLVLIVTAVIWGATNPFIKLGTLELDRLKQSRKYQNSMKFSQILQELQCLVSNLKFLIPFVLNLFGSILYYKALALHSKFGCLFSFYILHN